MTATVLTAASSADAIEPLPPGHVHADDYPTLQAAVDAVGTEGGVVHLGPRRYNLTQPLRLKGKIAFRGVMDAKIADASSMIAPGPGFQGAWLIQTVSQPAEQNPDLNNDIGFYDLVMIGSTEIGGLLATNVDVLRVERCRMAYMRRCIEVTQHTDLPRPFTAPIVPGGLFINASVFHAHDICINLEYATQNRIFGNWFVSNSSVILRLRNTNKTWFVANEVNQFKRSAVLLIDDNQGGNPVHDNVIALNWMHGPSAETKFFEIVGGEDMYDLMIANNILQGPAGMDLPTLDPARNNRILGNAGKNDVTAGEATVSSGQTRVTVQHRLFAAPVHVTLTPLQQAPGYWVENRGPTTFDIVVAAPAAGPLGFTWEARATR